jgi:hypothetical protein
MKTGCCWTSHPQRYPFMRHPGSESEFVELVEKYQVRNFY